MSEDKYIILSMQDKASEDVAKILSNRTSKRIVEALSEQSLSPNKLSKKLNIPISTVKYNLDQLIQVGMVKVKTTKWSVKGREVKYYEPAKKLILIAPEKSSKVLLSNLLNNTILPVMLVAVGLIGLLSNLFKKVSLENAAYGADVITKGAERLASSTIVISDLPIYSILFIVVLIIGIILLILKLRR